MFRPTASRLVRRLVPAAAALLLAAPALPRAQTPSLVPAARASDSALLTCAARTAPDHPITLTPAVTTLTRTIHARATLQLSDCRATTRAGRQLRSATVQIDARVRADCSRVTPLTGKATVTWRNGSGRRVGTSTVQAVRRTHDSANVADGLLAGKVTRGPMAGTEVSGSLIPTSSITHCADKGLRTLAGSGKVSLHR
ncbi:hypothetical protein [Streptomyces mexicanus]|uniref:hypothetical protein n=1 Tax=Streptomyces mexicanus TaxID=178566 RepID=UPI00368FB541